MWEREAAFLLESIGVGLCGDTSVEHIRVAFPLRMDMYGKKLFDVWCKCQWIKSYIKIDNIDSNIFIRVYR